MSASALFVAGEGDYHLPLTVRLASLPRHQFEAASRAYYALIDLLRKGRTELGEAVTDRFLMNNSPWLKGYSLRFVQKGLKALQDIGVIARKRQHGRRIITILVRLRGRIKPDPKAKAPAKGARPSVSMIPNVGVVADCTPEQVAASQALIAAAEAGTLPVPEPSAEDIATGQRFLEAARRRREGAAPVVRVASAPKMTPERLKRQLAEIRSRRKPPDPGPPDG